MSIEKAAVRLFNIVLPRRYHRGMTSWNKLFEFERDYYRWAAQSIIDTAAGKTIDERTLQRIRGGFKHGYSPKDGEGPEYRCWVQIKSRCFNPKSTHYKEYGGRGITICEKWRNNFPAFLADVGLRPSPKHSIDRFPNNDGNYEPGNVRWATKLQQQANRRTTIWVNFKGKRIPLTEACRILKVNRNIIWMRISSGKSPDEAIAGAIRSYTKKRR